MPLLEANLAAVSQNYDVIALAHSDVDSTMTWVSENLKGEITIGFSTPDMASGFCPGSISEHAP